MTGARPLKILHVMRAPVGGLFRHVVDLVRGQAARGHQVGVIADSTAGGARADAVFAELAPTLAFGVTRRPMSRHLGASDLAAWRDVARRAADISADVVHGHGAKGGAYARLGATGAVRAYTPHGGSLQFAWSSPAGMAYLTLERLLMRRTELMLFESAFARDAFAAKIGTPAAIVRVVHNGVGADEFQPIEPDPAATDIVFVGELRMLKGVDVLIDAIGRLAATGRKVTATIVGAGPDAAALAQRSQARGLGDAIRFPGAMPARQAFALGRLMVVPSRFESLPYIVLEVAAAGVPLLATAVGGVAEIFGPMSSRLLPAGDVNVLAQAIAAAMENPAGALADAQTLQARVREQFSADSMTEQVLAAYSDALAR
jgi:glycosyltransferase involved in cell wall biosynthesis